MNVVWLTNIPSPYKMTMLEMLGSKLDLVALVHREYKDVRRDDWFLESINNVKLHYIDMTNLMLVKKVIKDCDIFVNSYYSSIYGLIALYYAKKYKKICVLHADGGIGKDFGILINTGIACTMGRHNCFLSSSEITDRYFKYFLKKDLDIYHYRFSSLTNKDIVENQKMSLNKEFYKKKLGLDKFTYLSIGQPIRRKGFDILIKAFKQSGCFKNSALLIIGGKPTEDLIKLKNELSLNNVTFIDNISSNYLKEYYAASDVFVLATREDIWGLVINEAISFNLPFITSDTCVAGVHFNSKYNIGTIIKNEDIFGFAEAIKKAKENNYNYKEISSEYSIENTADDIYNALTKIYKKYGK